MPSRKQHTTAAALVRDVLQRRDHVGDTAQAGQEAEHRRPKTVHSSVQVHQLLPRLRFLRASHTVWCRQPHTSHSSSRAVHKPGSLPAPDHVPATQSESRSGRPSRSAGGPARRTPAEDSGVGAGPGPAGGRRIRLPVGAASLRIAVAAASPRIAVAAAATQRTELAAGLAGTAAESGRSGLGCRRAAGRSSRRFGSVSGGIG
jgi:hypothetical protein